MANIGWIEEFPGAITVCDLHGVVVDMNETAAIQYQKFGVQRTL